MARLQVRLCAAGRRRWRLDEVIHGLEGDSSFIASNASKLDALVERDRSCASHELSGPSTGFVVLP